MAETTLREQLQEISDKSKDRMPKEIREVMARTTQELVDSGIAGRALGPGDRAPGFELPDTDGTLVSSQALLDRGPLVVTFYRGVW